MYFSSLTRYVSYCSYANVAVPTAVVNRPVHEVIMISVHYTGCLLIVGKYGSVMFYSCVNKGTLTCLSVCCHLLITRI